MPEEQSHVTLERRVRDSEFGHLKLCIGQRLILAAFAFANLDGSTVLQLTTNRLKLLHHRVSRAKGAMAMRPSWPRSHRTQPELMTPA